jgi:hypothetical protein
MSPFKRKVLHLGGFDPRGARFYHQLLGEQVEHANRLAEVQGEQLRLTLSPRRRQGGDAVWDVTRSDGAGTTQFQFLAWDDLVRLHWPKGAVGLLIRMIPTYWRFLTRGKWREIVIVPRGSKIALIYPALMVARVAVPGALLVWLALLLPLHALWLPLHAVALVWALTLVPILLAATLIAIPLVERAHGLWLLRFVIFNDLLARERTDPALTLRLDAFAATILAGLEEDWDEVLLVTHSNGSILAMPIMARLLALRGEQLPDHFSLVTLGGSITLVGFRRDAHVFHAALDRVGDARFRWLDIGSPTDGASIPLVNPCITRPVGPPPGLIQMSPRWHRYCDPATYKARRADKYLTHFDYLRRLDKPSALDYIGLTCAARPLVESIAAFGAENG